MRRRLFPLFTLSLVLLLACAPSTPAQTPGENRSGLLPFTGFGLLVLAALAARLIAGGLEARRAATGRSTPQG